MSALETTASIADHRLVIQDDALPAHAESVRVIVLWESAKSAGRRSPPLLLAGVGEEKGDIIAPAYDQAHTLSPTLDKGRGIM